MKINEKTGNISVNGDLIVKNSSLEIIDVRTKEYMYKENIIEILNDINSMSVNSFVQEVVANV